MGIIPFDHSDLTLLELDPTGRFVEQSPMGAMKLWRHIREVRETTPGHCKITDDLEFIPKLPRFASRFVVTQLFNHRHRVLQRQFGTV